MEEREWTLPDYQINGRTLIEWGFKPGAWFGAAIKAAEQARKYGASEQKCIEVVAGHQPPPPIPLRAPGSVQVHVNLLPENSGEIENAQAVSRHMQELTRVPTIRSAAIMPDACPSGSAPGTIPVGGVIAAENAIHPGMHSADICCSMAISVLGDVDPKAVMDAAMATTHFGGGGREPGKKIKMPAFVGGAIENHPILSELLPVAENHFATQGDGNHFFFVGRIKSSGEVGIVTHHGSRALGAKLYKKGMETAQYHTRKISPETPKHNAWIPADTHDGRMYWDALQIIRTWTRENHFAIHNLVAGLMKVRVKERFWNEHNFVFRKDDGLFYHAKGATPAWDNFSSDSNGLTLIPLNMAQPILIVSGLNSAKALGFAPHGAGRNFSRSAYIRENANRPVEDIIREQTAGIDVRFYSGIPDMSELPGAYKNADSIRDQISMFNLADVVEEIDPIGSIMAGDWQANAPWRNKNAAKETNASSQ